MSLQKNDVMIDCKHCKFASSIGNRGFVITVPLQDLKTGGCKTAILDCAVSSENHQIEFRGWEDESTSSAILSRDLPARLSSTLAHVGKLKICGNAKICPAEVVLVVKHLSH